MKKILQVLLAVIIVIISVPFSAQAAEPSVIDVYGEKSVFHAAFGKVSYNGTNYDAYRRFDEAFTAITSAGGGKLYFSGTVDVSGFTDPAGRAPVRIIGALDGDNQNVLDFGSKERFELNADLSFDNFNIKSEAPLLIVTNGNDFSVVGDVGVYYTEKYVPNGDDILVYSPTPSVAVGAAQQLKGAISLDSGIFDVVTGGAYGSETLNVSPIIRVGGDAVVIKLVAGNSGNGSSVGSDVYVSGGSVTELYAGTIAGNVGGDINVDISGGSIDTLFVGAASGGAVSGNVSVRVSNGAVIGNIEKLGGSVGKTILILEDGAQVSVPEGVFDYVISTKGGKAEYTPSGFVLHDNLGIISNSAVINGVAAVSDANGLFAVPAGKTEIAVTASAALAINKNAKYVAGYEDGTFLPQNNMTRAEAITLLSRLIIDENLIKGKITSSYSDVADGAWYEPYIGLFENLGFLSEIDIAGGMSVMPEQHITRGEFVQLVYEISKLYENRAIKLTTIADVGSDSHNAQAIFYAVSSGIVTGYEDGTFRAGNNITRAEVVTIVNRFLGRNPTGVADGIYFYDTGNHWANGQILAACGGEGVSWTPVAADTSKYVMPGTDTKTNVIALHEQSAGLSGDAIREGIDMISDQIKTNVINSPDTLEASVTGTKYYISSVNGNNRNDGLSPETPFKNYTGLKSVTLEAGDGVFFERGGVYRGQLTVTSGVTYGAYGQGVKPVLMQSSRNYADERYWQETEYPNVWKMIFAVENAGIVAFDHDLTRYGDYDAQYGQIMNYNTFGFMGIGDLKNDLEFYSSISEKTLYLYSDKGNPGARFKSIEIGERKHVITGVADDVHLDNLWVTFTGAHGMGSAGGSKNRRVTNCVFSWLGGSVLKTNESTGAAVNYGNAVEIYGSVDGYFVENNWMYQIYDTGVTHQYSYTSEGDCIQKNIRYYGNLIEHVYWGIEVYNVKRSDTVRKTSDVHMSHNVLREGGNSWGSYTRFRETSAPLYSVRSLSTNSDELTEYNIFDRCLGNLISVDETSREVDDKNIYVQYVGRKFGELKGVKCDFGYDGAVNIETHFGDKNAVVVAVRE